MKRTAIFTLACLCSLGSAKYTLGQDNSNGFNVVPFEFDPAGTHLVAAEWKGGIGCPTSASTAMYPSNSPGSYSDPGCPTGDDQDKKVEGLLLAKTGPTSNNASAGATITGVKGISLYELGYDLRKPGSTTDFRGSHCGGGAPRFNVTTSDGVLHFIGCNSATAQNAGAPDWLRLRWEPATAFPPITPAETVKSISIVFDEGQDTGPDNFGLAVLDNIDINGTLVGRGPTRTEEQDEDKGQGQDSSQGEFQFRDSPSRPETSNLSYQNQVDGVAVQSINGARSVTYSAGCVTFLGDALLNNEPGYTLTFAACNVSALGMTIGNLSIAVAGPDGTIAYQKNAPLTSGYVQIHQ